MIYTGSHKNCFTDKYKLVSISGNRGKDVHFMGECYPALAPKLSFWKIWHDNIGKISPYDNNRYYIEEYYKQVLSKLDAIEVFENLDNSILLCYEEAEEFCHRHIVAAWLEIKLNIVVPEVKVINNELVYLNRPSYIKNELEMIMKKNIECELKYLYDGDNPDKMLDLLMKFFKENDYKLIKAIDKNQQDFYFDTEHYYYLGNNESIRIRQKYNEYKGTYKRSVSNSTCLVREEIEEKISSLDINLFIKNLKEKNIFMDDKIHLTLVVDNKRKDFLVEKDGIIICISLDNVVYKNVNGKNECDFMIEIELKNSNNNDILNDINFMILNNFNNLSLCNVSKYARGMNKTLNLIPIKSRIKNN